MCFPKNCAIIRRGNLSAGFCRAAVLRGERSFLFSLNTTENKWRIEYAVFQRSKRNVLRRQGTEPRSRAHSRRGEVGSGERSYGYFRAHARRGLVRSAAGRLQTDAERQERRDRGGARRDHRLLGYDAFRGDGGGNPPREDRFGSTQHRPRMRCDQHRDARAVSADRSTEERSPRSPRKASPWARGWKISEKDFAPRSEPCIRPRSRGRVISRWRKAT